MHDLSRTLKDQLSDITFILLTAQGTIESAVDAIKDGAYDYLSKPVDPQRLRILLNKAVERQETLREVKLLRRQLREQGSFGRIVGNSPAIRSLYRVIEQAAPTAASVLVWGESGTGKELVAQTDPRAEPARAVSRLSRSTAPRSPRRCSRAKSSVTRRAPSPARTTAAPACSSWRIAARSSSTKSPRWCRRRRSSCCACCRSERSAVWADARSRPSMCG